MSSLKQNPGFSSYSLNNIHPLKNSQWVPLNNRLIYSSQGTSKGGIIILNLKGLPFPGSARVFLLSGRQR